ncbi:MAG: NAD(P)-dependent oxidoreductase [Chitinophaga sp.]|uniref:NAD-dependent epimerase/dehydratase family protein n=1 Tax=Chitinophaga sp. TaxID=1869181 RepID=UPI0025BB3BC2|nr:NAD(P)-dependent oxidoreductase [Chitinophaga sp.]MBV8254357.1 NAD(P)-dependent oxidoreductase [Chitinophaga sp.]
MNKVLITGATGFLGSYITHFLLDANIDVIGLKRGKSGMSRLNGREARIKWINMDEPHWQQEVEKSCPDIFIHCAWLGVESFQRNVWEIQLENINLLQQLLSLAIKCKANKFIGLGSQAEYGAFDGVITEQSPLAPNSVYGQVKVCCSKMVESCCAENGIEWFWLRLFTFFGAGEGENWLIPSTVKAICNKEKLELTAGEQKYAYMHASVLGNIIGTILASQGKEGIYNISSYDAVSIKELVTRIRNVVDKDYQLSFGSLPYRPGQAMHMQGDMTKYNHSFGIITDLDLEDALRDTINYYLNIFNHRLDESI